MDRLTHCTAWIFGAVLLLSSPTFAAPTLECADDTPLQSCTPQQLWATFAERFRWDAETGESTDWISQYLTPDEQEALQTLLSAQSSSMADTQLLTGKLPQPAVLAWQMVTGAISPEQAALAAHNVTEPEERLPLVEMLTLLKPSMALAQALSWTLESKADSYSALPWLVQARLPAAQLAAIDKLVQCSRDKELECARDLPVGPYFNASQVQTAWRSLLPRDQAALLARTSVGEVEPFLRRELMGVDSRHLLDELWNQIEPGDGDAAKLLARLIMERLLDPVVAAEERFTAQIDHAVARDADLPYLGAEIGAWHLLAQQAAEEAPLHIWQAQARSLNRWVALIGTAGLLAGDREADARVGLVAISDDRNLPPEALLRLLKSVDSNAADRMYADVLAAPARGVQQACRIAASISSTRAKFLSADLARWTQGALALVDQSSLPGLEIIRAQPAKQSLPEPLRSVVCIGDTLVLASKKPTADMRRLGMWLEDQPAEMYRLLGSVIQVEQGEFQALERLVADLAKETTPERQQVHADLQAALEAVRRRHQQSVPDRDSALALCRKELSTRGVDPASVLYNAWEMQVGGEAPRALLTLRFGSNGRAECDVDFGSEPRVIRLEVAL